MKVVYLRLDGVVADIISEFSSYMNRLGQSLTDGTENPMNGWKKSSAEIGLSRYALSKRLQFVSGQPEPYNNMKLYKGVIEGIEKIRNIPGYEVRVFTSPVHKLDKVKWMVENTLKFRCDFVDTVDSITRSSPNERYVFIDTDMWSSCPTDALVFARDGGSSKKSDNYIYTWNDPDFLRKIENKFASHDQRPQK